ncbi:MAG: triose-phosphate isomerase [Bacteroidales bacterium]|nr:triose-phosphate isomerase [Bacteroidales bacterium]
MRQKIVAGNWKMNTFVREGLRLTEELIKLKYPSGVKLIIAPPYTHLFPIQSIVEGTLIELAAQNLAKENQGAFTGEISADILKDMGIKYSIIGHSERRMYYGENDAILFSKVEQALKNNLAPIFCIGESLDERENNEHFKIINHQLQNTIFKLSRDQFKQIIIAYEPVWAIGTGKTASPEQAQEIHAYIRTQIAEQFDNQIADGTSILYGGSCKPSNAKELFSMNDIDGGLIGGAALNSEDFIAIANSF